MLQYSVIWWTHVVYLFDTTSLSFIRRNFKMCIVVSQRDFKKCKKMQKIAKVQKLQFLQGLLRVAECAAHRRRSYLHNICCCNECADWWCKGLAKHRSAFEDSYQLYKWNCFFCDLMSNVEIDILCMLTADLILILKCCNLLQFNGHSRHCWRTRQVAIANLTLLGVHSGVGCLKHFWPFLVKWKPSSV